MSNENSSSTPSTTDIDKALAAAKARKAAKSDGAPATEGAPKPPRPRLSDEDRKAALAKIEQERADRKAAKEKERAEAAAKRAAETQPAHMKKVERAGERLGALSPQAQLIFNEASTNLTAADLATLAEHILHFNRVQATKRALGDASELKVDQLVRIEAGDYPAVVGQIGTVVKVSRIRCYVNVPGANNRPVPGCDSEGLYFYCSVVTPVNATAATEPAPAPSETVSDESETDHSEASDEPIAAAS